MHFGDVELGVAGDPERCLHNTCSGGLDIGKHLPHAVDEDSGASKNSTFLATLPPGKQPQLAIENGH